MAVPVTLTSRILNKIMPGRKRRIGIKIARLVDEAGKPHARRRWRKLDTEDKIWDEVTRYLKKGAQINESSRDHTALENACCREYADIARKLVEHGADVNASGKWYRDHTPIMWTAMNANESMTRFLLEKGANPNHITEYGRSALQYLAEVSVLQKYKGAPPAKPVEATACLKAMLEHGFTPDEKQKILVFTEAPALADVLPDVKAALDMKALVETNNLPALREMLAAGVSPDILKDYPADTPLCHAAASGNIAMIELLLTFGAGLEVASPTTKYTPLQAATFNGQKEAFVTLLHKGADAKAHCAVKYDDPTTLTDVAKHSVNPLMNDFIQNVMDTMASAPPPVNTDAPIKVNKPLRIRQSMP